VALMLGRDSSNRILYFIGIIIGMILAIASTI